MRILYKEPLKDAVVMDIEDDIKVMQELVGGYIETVKIFSSIDMVVVVNEMGKIEKLKPNIYCGQDVLVGNIFFIGIDIPEMRGLSDDELELASNLCKEMDIRNY